MKLKSILSLALLILTTVAFSQSSNLRRAKTSYGKFNDLKSVGSTQLGEADLKAAHQALIKAVEHDRTKDLAETWLYYGLVTSDLALLDESDKSKDLLNTAIDAYEKAKSLDSKNELTDNITVLAYNLAQYEMNLAVKAWDSEEFNEAHKRFSQAEIYVPGDTTLLFYAGAAAINDQNYQAGLEKYLKLLDAEDYSNHKIIVLEIPRIYEAVGDTLSASKYANIGMGFYPEDTEVVTQYIEYNLLTGKDKEVIETIMALSSKEPNNETLYYYLGLAYDSMSEVALAEESYRKALSINPNFVEANINLGWLIITKGINQWNLINGQREITQAEYDEGIGKAHVIFDSAYPYLQKAVDIDNSNVLALLNLQRYYEIKDNKEKSDELQAKIDALQ